MASQPILEYQNFVELCDLMFIGPHKGLDDGEKFSYMVLWGGAKALQLWRNAGMSVKSVKNLQQVLKDYCVPSELKFWANRMEMRHITQKPNETFQDYTVRVMALADTCEWKDKDEQIICALIFGANHRDAQRKALSKPKDINSLESTGDNGRQPPLLPPRPRTTRVDTRIHNYRLSAAP